MAFESGGMANKLGNRYEGRWVAKQLLRLLNEEIHSVIVELICPLGVLPALIMPFVLTRRYIKLKKSSSFALLAFAFWIIGQLLRRFPILQCPRR